MFFKINYTDLIETKNKIGATIRAYAGICIPGVYDFPSTISPIGLEDDGLVGAVIFTWKMMN